VLFNMMFILMLLGAGRSIHPGKLTSASNRSGRPKTIKL
jgi:hypothetical protein